MHVFYAFQCLPTTTLPTNSALVWLFARVRAHVHLQVYIERRRVIAQRALVWLFATVQGCVRHQTRFANAHVRALLALVGLFARVRAEV